MAAVRNLAEEIRVSEPVYASDPDWVREQRAEWRERLLQEDEDYAYRASVGTGDDDWTGSVNE